MSSSKELDVMLGDPRKALLAMAGPLIISYLIIELNTFMDLTWCSGLGSICTSAVASISPVSWIFSGLGTGIGVGAAAVIAGHLGTGDSRGADNSASQTIVITIVLALATMAVVPFLVDPLIDMMGVTDIRSECHDYIDPMTIGSIAIVFNGVVAGILRGEGAAKRSTYVLISAAVSHMVLDPLLIYGLGMGLAGASTATVIGMGIGAVVGLQWFVRDRTVVKITLKGYRPMWGEIRSILGIGIPRTIEILIISLMSMIQRIFVVQCGGTQASMYYNLPWNFVSLAQSISMAFGAALIPISSAAQATGLPEKSRAAYHHAILYSLIPMAAIAAIVFIFADMFVIPFTYSDSMAPYRPEFVHVMRIYMLIVPAMSVIDVASSMLQSLRKSQLSMISTFIRNGMIVLTFVWAATVSLDAIYWCLVVCEVLGAILMATLAQACMAWTTGMKCWEFRDRLRHE